MWKNYNVVFVNIVEQHMNDYGILLQLVVGFIILKTCPIIPKVCLLNTSFKLRRLSRFLIFHKLFLAGVYIIYIV